MSPALLLDEGARSTCSTIWFFQSDGKSFQVPFLSCGPLSTHLARLSEVLQYSRAGGQAGRAGQRMDPILLSPLTRGKKKRPSATSLSGFCAPFVLRHRSRTQKNGPGGKLDTARPHVSHRHLEAEVPGTAVVEKKKKKESTERRFHACGIPVLMTTSPPTQPFCYLTHVFVFCNGRS